MQWLNVWGVFFRERESYFSIGLRAIRPSEFVRTRSKAVLCDEGNAWAPVSGFFDKLHEVGVLSDMF